MSARRSPAYYEVDETLASGIRDVAAREGLADRVIFVGETRDRSTSIFARLTSSCSRRGANRSGWRWSKPWRRGCRAWRRGCLASPTTSSPTARRDSWSSRTMWTALGRALTRVLTDRFAGRRARSRGAARGRTAFRDRADSASHVGCVPARARHASHGDRRPHDPAPSDILCISSIDWDFIWQGHQEIMSTLAAQGHRVLFLENTGVRAPQTARPAARPPAHPQLVAGHARASARSGRTCSSIRR